MVTRIRAGFSASVEVRTIVAVGDGGQPGQDRHEAKETPGQHQANGEAKHQTEGEQRRHSAGPPAKGAKGQPMGGPPLFSGPDRSEDLVDRLVELVF
jgi:hypothetical protein